MTQESNGASITDVDPMTLDSADESTRMDGGIQFEEDSEPENAENRSDDQPEIPAVPIYQAVIKVDGVLDLLGTELGGGILPASLTLVEGSAELGKSVLCQHFTYAALEAGNSVAFVTSNHNFNSLVAQMASIDLGISDYLGAEKISVLNINGRTWGRETDLSRLATEVDRLTNRHKIIIVDAFTDVAENCDKDAIVDFITACSDLRIRGRAIVIVAESSGVEEKTLEEFSSHCDNHIRLRGAKLGSKQVTTIEVMKSRNETLDNSNILRIEVRPKAGMRILSMPRPDPVV